MVSMFSNFRWGTIFSVNPRNLSRPVPYYDDGERRDDCIMIVNAGSLNVRGSININHIDKVVVNTREFPVFQTLEQAIRRQAEVGGETEAMLTVEGSDDPVAAQV